MWFQLKIQGCPSQKVHQLSEELVTFGALSVMLTDQSDKPILEPEPGTTPLWPEVMIQALYAEVFQAQYTRDELVKARPSLICTLDVLEDKDWERLWMDDFKPQRFGKSLWISPSWSKPPRQPNTVNLILDPGLAFGTGNHPTTALCLTWLEQACLKNKTLIDYGCGSGILSLAALKLGAKQVHAVDNDPQALQSTENNALVNGLEQQRLSISLPDTLQEPVDLIIANILLSPLIILKDRFQKLLKHQGILVVSGLLEEQAPLLIETYSPIFVFVKQHCLNGWSLLVFTNELRGSMAV